GMANLQRGYGASAVLDLDDAVSRYQQICAAHSPPRLTDLARVLSENAVTLKYFGDPDLAVGAADRAIRIYVNRGGGLDLVGAQSLERAARVAAEIHGEFGRLDAALDADRFCVMAFEQFLAQGSVDARDDLIKALVRESVHLAAAGRSDEAVARRAQAREL